MNKIEPGGKTCILNLPEPILECILKLLSPVELVGMSQVCTYLKYKCRSDPLWEVHIKKKWDGIIGDVVYKEWQWHITRAKEKGINQLNENVNENGSLWPFSGTWPMLYLRSYLQDCTHLISLANSPMMALYFSLENGKFWFPAQVYKGYLVRDALVRYDSKTDNFEAREQSAGWQVMGNNLKWDSLRAPAVDNPAWVRYHSDCLQDLRPGDHVEIQWKSRRSDDIPFPYDWWYAVIGHTESCNENDNLCRCRDSETLLVKFKQFSNGTNMKGLKVLRNGEESKEENGNGGIRKLNSEEVQRWETTMQRNRARTAYSYCGGGFPRRLPGIRFR